MADRINDIAWQAHQGSVAAIIQILNEKLANSGVRTRAIFNNGVLQLLCEARTVDKLEKSILVKQIEQILESIAPRKIHRVNINSRIVREQQLLWLEEISRDSENQLLWSQEITLVKPNILKQLIKDFREYKSERDKQNLHKYQFSRQLVLTNQNNLKNSSRRRMLTAAGTCVFLLLLGGAVYALLSGKFRNPIISSQTPNFFKPATTNQKKPEILPVDTDQRVSIPPSDDPFAAAVRIANQASTAGKTATSSTQWLDLAARWQRASELMSTVPPNHSRYQEAQIRTKLYKKYSEAAEEESKKRPS